MIADENEKYEYFSFSLVTKYDSNIHFKISFDTVTAGVHK